MLCFLILYNKWKNTDFTYIFSAKKRVFLCPGASTMNAHFMIHTCSVKRPKNGSSSSTVGRYIFYFMYDYWNNRN